MIRNFLYWKFVCCQLCELSAQPHERRGGQGTYVNDCLAAAPYPSLGSCG
jgi:hypothetical protein